MDPTESSNGRCIGHTHDKESVNMEMALKGFFHSFIYSFIHSSDICAEPCFYLGLGGRLC